jgi:hypothetical protein
MIISPFLHIFPYLKGGYAQLQLQSNTKVTGAKSCVELSEHSFNIRFTDRLYGLFYFGN